AAWLLPIVMLVPAGCTEQQKLMSQLGGDSITANAQVLPQPLVNPTSEHQASTDARVPVYDIPRFAINSPFDTEYDSPVPKEGKRLWATSRLWAKRPPILLSRNGSQPSRILAASTFLSHSGLHGADSADGSGRG
ncbi:MAG: hypothetical protein ACYTDW_03965, partial [Planctomycetota bacterium]